MKYLLIAGFLITGAFAQFTSFSDLGSCGKYNESAGKHEKEKKMHIAAFMSGVNFVKNRIVSVDLPSQISYVNKYCIDQPLKNVLDALGSLDQKLDQ